MRRKTIPWNEGCLRVGCLSTPGGLELLAQTHEETDLIEIRYDAMRSEGVSADSLKQALPGRKHPVLLTLRTVDEGGQYTWKSRERVLLFLDLIPHVDAIDIELANVPLLKEVLRQARAEDCPIVLSTHSIQRKFTTGKLQRLVSEFRHHRAAIYKIAGLARTRKDLATLLEPLLEAERLPFAIMAIGPMAASSRVVLPAMGSRLVYGYLDKPSAPGQPGIAEASRILRQIGI